jgi:hypothetical protein
MDRVAIKSNGEKIGLRLTKERNKKGQYIWRVIWRESERKNGISDEDGLGGATSETPVGKLSLFSGRYISE